MHVQTAGGHECCLSVLVGKASQLATVSLHHLFISWYGAVDYDQTLTNRVCLNAVFFCRKHSLALVPNLSRMQTTVYRA